jgi:glycosyltransferase involved in cell wall biosynthesis
MKIGIIAHDLTSSSVRGLARYTAGLIRALAATGCVEVVLFARAPLAAAYRSLPGERCVWPGLREVLWEQWDLPRRAAARGVDVIHAPANRGLCAFAACPTVLTRHDAIERLVPPDFPGSFRSRLRMYYADAISIRRAAAVVTVSETSKRDIQAVWGVNGDRVTVAGEGIDDRFFAGVARREVARVSEKYYLAAPYVLYLGGMEQRKDLVTLIDAYAAWGRHDIACVLAGSTRGEPQRVRERVQQHGLDRRVRVLGEVDDHDVAGLYAGAACFVYPSRYEGFGLQAAEAMAVGIPVIVSDGGALPEVVGDGALVFHCGAVSELVQCLDRLFSDRALRDALVARGRQRAERFRWDKVVPGYVSLYRALAGGRRPLLKAFATWTAAPSKQQRAPSH